MKCACDRCERIATIGSEEYLNNWRKIVVQKEINLNNFPISSQSIEIDTIHLCDKCYDEFCGFAHGPHIAKDGD